MNGRLKGLEQKIRIAKRALAKMNGYSVFRRLRPAVAISTLAGLFLLCAGGCIKKKVPIPSDAPAGRVDYRDIPAAVMAQRESLSILIHVAILTGESEFFRTRGPFTVFAPTNKAFSKIPQDRLTRAWNEPDDELFGRLFRHTYAKGYFSPERLREVRSVPLEDGLSAVISNEGGILRIDGRPVTASFLTENGILYLLDELSLPPGLVEPLLKPR